MATQEERRKNDDEDVGGGGGDRWMGRCTDGGDLHPLCNGIAIVRKKKRIAERERERAREQDKSAMPAKTINNNSQ